MGFKKATKTELWLRMALAGPAGSGKTYSALTLAKWLANGRRVAVIDTERGSASKYADLFDFDVLELEHFHPQRYVEAIHEAVASGYAVIVIDSLSHAWSGKGGILEIVQRKGNSFQAWGEVKPVEATLIEAVTGAPIHVIATMRSKTEYVVEKDERGKSAPRKVGLAPVQRDGLEYEFDVFGELDQENTLMIQKTRCPALAGAVISKPGRALAETLRTWLASAPAPTPEPTAPPTASDEPTEDENDGDEAIYFTQDDPDLEEDLRNAKRTSEPKHEMTRAEFLAALRDELNLNATQAMERLKVRSLNGLNLDMALETLRQSLTQRPEPEPTYNPKADVNLRQRLNALGIRSLADVEVFVAEAEEQGDGLSLRDACFAYLERCEASGRAQRAAVKRGNRGPSALGAVGDGEPVPESLEGLETGARAS